MNVNSPTLKPPSGAPISPQHADPVRNVRSTHNVDPINMARKRFCDEGEEQFRSGDLTARGHALVKAVVYPDKAGAPGVQVSTFAVNGFQSQDMVMIQRVPPSTEGPNFVVYMPEDEFMSFHEFDTVEQMTDWVKAVATDPIARAQFVRHFANSRSPEQQGRVEQSLVQFEAGDTNVVVGRFAIVKGDVFERLNMDVVPFEGLCEWKYVGVGPKGTPIYQGRQPDGQVVLYSFDAYGNLQGARGKNEYFFVQNGLNEHKALIPMTQKKFLHKVVSSALDNSGANDLRGLLDELVKQLRNPGHSIGTALKELGVPDDVATSIEEILKNPVAGTLLELNHDNRIGKVFGVDKETMDARLESVGHTIQSNIPRYGTWRKRLNELADTIEEKAGTYEEPSPEVRT